ncbi:MAG: dipeptidase [Vicinamibacteria bacterium]|nr:dipeptidase [Vicinamibacteria bacterium]
MTFRRASALLTVVFAAVAGLSAQSASSVADRAAALHKTVPVIDGHNDYPWALREKSPGRDLNVLDIRQPQPSLMTDISRLRAGGVGGQFWSVYVPSTMQGKEAVRATLEQIDIVHRMVAKYPETFVLTRTADDVERAFKAGKIGSMIGMEGGHSIDSSLATLRMMHALGAGYMTLTHSSNVPWADSATDTPALGGLSPFGEAVVREMNRLGMLVDLSHVSPDTMADAIRVSKAPVIFSHSSARAVCDHPRNVPDEILTQLPANGGVVMVTFVPGFIAPEAGKLYPQTSAMMRQMAEKYADDPAGMRAARAEWRKTHPEPKATLSMVADHIDHIRKVAGIDHIGLGGDFDGIDTVIAGLEDVSKYPALTAELLRRGYSDDDVKKILGLNILRVMRRAEAVAVSMKGEPPSVAVDK